MQVVLLRVGIDSGCGGLQGPLFADGSFEFVPIPDEFEGRGVCSKTYGTTLGRHGRVLLDYFPERRRKKYQNHSIHDDPEFETFTYGDPTSPKRSLQKLKKGDLLVFYAGLEPWPLGGESGLHIVGYFEVLMAGVASDLSEHELKKSFRLNFHVRHKQVLDRQKKELVLIKGGVGSRLLKKAALISAVGMNRAGRSLKVLSPEARTVFGDFSGHVSIERSPPRWVKEEFVEKGATFVRNLE